MAHWRCGYRCRDIVKLFAAIAKWLLALILFRKRLTASRGRGQNFTGEVGQWSRDNKIIWTNGYWQRSISWFFHAKCYWTGAQEMKRKEFRRYLDGYCWRSGLISTLHLVLVAVRDVSLTQAILRPGIHETWASTVLYPSLSDFQKMKNWRAPNILRTSCGNASRHGVTRLSRAFNNGWSWL